MKFRGPEGVFALVMAGALAALVSSAALVSLAALSGCSSQAAVPAAEPVKVTVKPCPPGQPPGFDTLEGRVECGEVRVPEDRGLLSGGAVPDGGRVIALNLIVLRGLQSSADAPVFFFTGGPGSGATRAVVALSRQLSELRATRDFVFIDQRGTGASNLLQCAPVASDARRLSPMFDRAETEACREQLAPSADLRFYTTGEASLDVDDVRRALGYARINLHGSSYGTRAVWDYAARFPAHARAIVMHGPAPPNFRLPLPFAKGLDEALEGLAADCAADTACAKRFPDFRRDLAKAFDALKTPATVTLTRDGSTSTATFTRGELAEALRYLLYDAGRARAIPSMIASAARGDYRPVIDALIAERRLNETLARGMYLTVTCTEDIPAVTEADIHEATAGTRLGDYRIRQQQDACRSWPRGAAPTPALNQPLQTPALVIVGQYDPATPLAQARAGMSLLPNGRLAVVPHGAHSLGWLGINGCMNRATIDFLMRGSASGVDISCFASARRPAFALD